MTATARRSNRPTTNGTTSPRDDGYGRARFVGDAAPVAGIPLSRVLNAACYVISGIAIIVIGVQVGHGTAGAAALGLAAIAYGVYVVLSRGSYWVSSWIYVLTIIAVLGMFGAFAR
ncbi:hypothetical protein TEK04_14965 [Klenkia sp. LSe6-5]|uniref:Uncharacterized protein n=1 Tax=Klenkia sesuvii TaxID=3103137 RepID=A0ABU8DW07_9ACTN